MGVGILKDKITSCFKCQNIPQDIKALIFKKVYVFISLCSLLSLIYIISYLGEFSLIDSIKKLIGVFVLSISKIIAIIIGKSFEIDWLNSIIFFNNKSYCFISDQMFALRYYLAAIIFVLVLGRRPLKIVIDTLVIWSLFIFLSSLLHVFRFYNTQLYLNFNFVTEEIMSFFLIGYVFLNYLKVKKTPFENSWLQFLLKKQIFLYFFVGLVWWVVTLYPHYIDKQFFYDIITKITFKITSILLNLFGFENYYVGRYLYGKHITIFMNNECVGIRIIQVFILIMVFLKGKPLLKIPYILTGIFLVFFINALRIFLFFRYFEISWWANGVDKDYFHNLYNYIVYFAVICLWLFYIFFFKKWTEGRLKNNYNPT